MSRWSSDEVNGFPWADRPWIARSCGRPPSVEVNVLCQSSATPFGAKTSPRCCQRTWVTGDMVSRYASSSAVTSDAGSTGRGPAVVPGGRAFGASAGASPDQSSSPPTVNGIPG